MPAHPSYSLNGLNALVTGVSRRSGIGFAIAQRLKALGADIFVQSWTPHDEDQPWGTGEVDLDRLLEELGASSFHLAIDLSDPRAPQTLVEHAVNALGHIDILVCNHARSSQQSLEELTAKELDLSFQVNARATLLLVKEWAAQYDTAQESGRVILLSSGQHRNPMPFEIPYASSKAVVQQMTAALASHLAPRKITVNCINPGPTDTGWATPETQEWVLHRMPFGRWGAPDDAARLVGWLASTEGRWVTGQTIDSEGGFAG